MHANGSRNFVLVMAAMGFAGCASAAAPEATASGPSASAVTSASADPTTPVTEAEPCRVFVLVREPTVKTERIANVVAHGNTSGSLVTLIDQRSDELIATTVGDLETSICKRFEPRPYLLYLFKQQDKTVGLLSSPIAPPDRGRDAQTLCDSERVGAGILPKGSATEQRSIGLQQAAGGLTTPEYRAMLFDALHKHDEASIMDIIRSLDVDLRAVSMEAWDACPLLIKK